MGKVFSWDEIEAGQVPTIADISSLAQQIKAVSEQSEAILAGSIVGSVMYGRHSRRSDIDFVVVYDRDREHAANELFSGLYRESIRIHVPLEIIDVRSDLAATSLHDISQSFADHCNFTANASCIIKRHPRELLSPHIMDRNVDICNYVCRKAARLNRMYRCLEFMSDSEYFRYLQKTLEAPIHIARRVLILKQGKLADDSKSTVIKQYPNIADAHTVSLLQRLLALDAEYSAELEQQLTYPNQSSYQAMLDRIEQAIPDAIAFAQHNLLLVSRSL